MSPRISLLAKSHADSLTPQITKLLDDVVKVERIRDEVLEKIKEILDNGSHDVLEQRYQAGKNINKSLTTITDEEPKFQPKVVKFRLLEPYLPDKAKAQNYESPLEKDLSFDRHIIGIGDYGNL